MNLKGEGIPIVLCYGNNYTHNILVLQLLGKNLEQLFLLSGKKFSMKTTCVLGIQMLDRIKFVHENLHIHRDIKPDNFAMGINENENKVFLLDFGLAKKFIKKNKNLQTIVRNHKHITGSARYCSINTHEGKEQSRSDDLESIGYILIYFLKGILPWQGEKITDDEDKYLNIANKKKLITIEELCKGMPGQYKN